MVTKEIDDTMCMVICNTCESNLYWSNEDGWVEDVESATKFTKNESNRLNLPLEGFWREL